VIILAEKEQVPPKPEEEITQTKDFPEKNRRN
jgi:hypothetical protein